MSAVFVRTASLHAEWGGGWWGWSLWTDHDISEFWPKNINSIIYLESRVRFLTHTLTKRWHVFIPVWKVFAAVWLGRQTKFLSRRTNCKKKNSFDARTPENPQFCVLKVWVLSEISRGFWLLINRLHKLFSKTYFCLVFEISKHVLLPLFFSKWNRLTLPGSLWNLVLPWSEQESITPSGSASVLTLFRIS